MLGYVLKHGVLGWGLGTGILWAVIMARLNDAPLERYLAGALIGFPAGGAVLGLLMWRFSPQRAAAALEHSPLAQALRSAKGELATKVIYAYEPRWLTADRLYLVYVAGSALHFLRVGGQLFAAKGGSYPDDPAAYASPALLERYAGLDLADPSTLGVDSRNFLVPFFDVRSAELRSRRSLWTQGVPNSGFLRLRIRDRTRKFILLGRQDHAAIGRLLAEAGIVAEVERGAGGAAAGRGV